MKDFIQRHNRLVFLLVGLAMLIPIGYIGKYSFDLVVEEKETRISELSTRLVERERTINTLTEAYQKLEKQSKTHTIIKADGSTETWTEDSLKSETQVREQVKEEYKETIKEEIAKVKEELSKTSSSKNKLNLGVGMTQELDYAVTGAYQVYGNFTINGGLVVKSQTYMLGLGINL